MIIDLFIVMFGISLMMFSVLIAIDVIAQRQWTKQCRASELRRSRTDHPSNSWR